MGLNLLQRMSGIASATRDLQEFVHRRNAETHLVGTRKTPWGLLDKRAMHLGGGGTHRLGLWDAILIKNNHLALLAEPRGRRGAHRRASAPGRHANPRRSSKWKCAASRRRSRRLKRFAACANCRERQRAAIAPASCCWTICPPRKRRQLLRPCARESLLDHVLIEASGNISESNIEEYAASGVDAISMGALTHSARALDLCQRV